MINDESQDLPWLIWNDIAVFDDIEGLQVWERIFSLADIKDVNNRNLLHTFCHFNSTKCVQHLAHAYPALTREKDVLGELPLHRACYGKSYLPVVEAVAFPDIVNAPTWFGATPLHYALHGAPRDVLNFLEAMGADWSLPDRQGVTPRQAIADNV